MARNLSEAYSEWLGIPPEEQPANYYRLLDLPLFQADPAEIERAATRQIEQVELHRAADASLVDQMLRELTAARNCLLQPGEKAAYDEHLRRKIAQAHRLWIADSTASESPPARLGRYTFGTLRYLLLVLRRGWLRRLQLPAAYRQFGKTLYHEGRCREQFARLFGRLDRTTEALRKVYRRRQQREETGPVAWWQRPWRLAVTLWLWLRSVWLTRGRNSLFGKLGKTAYAAQSTWSGREEMIELLRQTLQRIDRLNARIELLSQVPPGRTLSPKCTAQLILALVFVCFLFFSGLLGWLLSWVLY